MKKKRKYKRDWWEFPGFLLEFFFLTFILLYLNKFGISEFLFITENTGWKFLFNLGLFYMMVIFFLNGTLKKFNKWLGEKKKND